MADGSHSARPARPFLKWVGGKRQLLPELSRRIPARFGTYHEPFLGGGALFFHLRPPSTVLSDTNVRLVRTWRGVRDDPERVITLLDAWPHDREFFLAQRARPIDEGDDADVAAWMIYLNRTGFNGLYRVNRSNQFNVPFGSYTHPTICDPDNLRAVSAALQGVRLEVEDFGAVLHRAHAGDLVYFDPPYVPLSATSSFTGYTATGFGLAEQLRLRDVARALKASGVHVILSNSAAPLVEALYGDGFVQIPVDAARALNCKGARRGKIRELIIC